MLRPVLAFLVLALSTLSSVSQVQAGCPWKQRGLRRWSDRRSWSSGRIPREGDDVVIPTEKKIVLDEPIPRLRTLTVNGVLVWGNVKDLRLETGFIEVNGEFHMGSEDCRLERRADIFLYGQSNSSITHGSFGTKFIGANPGGKLEIHGQEKKSWSKLVSTVKPLQPEDCGVVYDSKKGRSGTRAGIHITVWDSSGNLYDFDQFETSRWSDRTASALVSKINNLPTDKIVSLIVYKTIGQPSQKFNAIYEAIENIGGSQIRNVGQYEPYVLITVPGQKQLAVEQFIPRPTSENEGIEAKAQLVLGELVFRVISVSVKSRWRDEATFRVLKRNTAFPKLSLLHDVSSWKTGDKAVVASTDYDWKQAEVKTIVECSDCEVNEIRVDSDFRYMHFGEVTFGVDERAEVGLLSRNIRIEAELQPQCYAYNKAEQSLCKKFGRDTFGGHLKVLRGAVGHIEGAELVHMGQQSLLAKYPIHFHLCDEVPGQYARNNAIRDSNSRCITIHGTDRLEVSDNVCFNHLGHGIFLEDSAEQHNKIHRNLIIGTQHGTLLLTDMKREWCKVPHFCDLLSSIWITHPNNNFTENVAAGSDGFGIVLSFSDRPLGPSLQRQKERGLYRDKSSRYMKVPEFSRNVMHSNYRGGLWFDDRISYGQPEKGKFVPENGKLGMNYYLPREPPIPNGKPVDTVLSELTLYKNQDRNAWVRSGNIVITNSSFADSPTSYVSAHSVGASTSDVRHSIFIGETANKGEPWTYTFSWQLPRLSGAQRPRQHFDRSFAGGRPDYMISGVAFYQGPVILDNCYFDQFTNRYFNDSMIDAYNYRPKTPMAAITFHPNNHYPMMPTSGVRNLKFGYCDGRRDSFRMMNGNATTPYWGIFDGTGNANIQDYDGGLTGVPGSHVVQDRPFFTGPECLKKPDWGLSVCPYHYFLLVVRGKDGVLTGKYRTKYPVQIRQDDDPTDVYSQSGINGHKYILRSHTSYTITFNATLGPSPKFIQLRPKFGLEKNETVRLALCLPKSTTTFGIWSRYPRIDMKRIHPQWVSSIEELDADTTMKAFFWDKENGYLYLKMSSPYSMTKDDQECPGDKCLEINILREDGGVEPAVCTSRVPSYTPNVPVPRKVRKPRCRDRGSPKGLGAPVEEGYSAPVPSPFDNMCGRGRTRMGSRPIARGKAQKTPQQRGCFAQSPYRNDFIKNELTLKYTLTPEICIERCSKLKFPFAGMYVGSVCTCSESVGRNGISRRCSQSCSGDKSQKCGGRPRDTTVYRTGAALPPSPKRCGNQDRGVVFEGKCIYINYMKEFFDDAQERCVRQGGDLVKIDSEEKMRFIEAYLSDFSGEVWIGVEAVGRSWKYMDGSVLDRTKYGNWRTGFIRPANGRSLFLQAKRGFTWNVSPRYRIKMGLCDLPLNGPNISGDPVDSVCNSGVCFMKINSMPFKEAKQFCKSRYGRMASVRGDDERALLETYLNTQQDRSEFWVDGGHAPSGRKSSYSKSPPRKLVSSAQKKLLKSVCVVEESTNGCPNINWVKHNGSCYFNTEMSVRTFVEAQALCSSDQGFLLTLDSKAETDFVKTLVNRGNVLLDYKYDSFQDAMLDRRGKPPAASLWSSGEKALSIDSGLCVVAYVTKGQWRHTPCSDRRLRNQVVCKAKVLS